MPRQTGLITRNGRYHFNLRVPKDLRSLYGKEHIRESLGTSDYRKAVEAARHRASRAEIEFAQKRRELASAQERQAPRKISELTDAQAHELVFSYLIQIEKENEDWWLVNQGRLDEHDRRELIQNLRIDQTVYSGGGAHYDPVDATMELNEFLKSEGIECAKDSIAYRKLSALFLLATLENIKRAQDRVSLRPVVPHEPLFRNVFGHTPLPKKCITLEELIKRHQETQRNAGNVEGTLMTYCLPSRLLLEFFGPSKRIDEITNDDAEEFLKALNKVPTNARMRYKGLSLLEAVEAAEAKKDPSRLRAKTRKNYFTNLSSIFNFALEKRMIDANPFKDRYTRAAFIGAGPQSEEKSLFSVDELNALFRAPLYTGCVDDKRGSMRVGPNKPRRGRFWVPLISLFHGTRLNEAAQLYTADIGEEGGIPCFYIRDTLDNEVVFDKRLKTKQSFRRVPLHPEFIKLGFLDYVAERAKDPSDPHLFPELPLSSKKNYSDPFSKWFSRFKKSVLGTGCKATFHSLRHHFRTALGEARTPLNDVELLGGWESSSRSSEKLYDKPTVARLYSCIKEVRYPGLDLSHLHVRE